MAPIRRCAICVICKKIYSRLNDDKRKFMTTFPLDEKRCRQWVQIIGNEELAYIPIEKLHEAKYVCGDHFRSQDFNKEKSCLNEWAIPSVLINVPPLSDHILAEFPCHIANSEREPNETYISCDVVNVAKYGKYYVEQGQEMAKARATSKIIHGVSMSDKATLTISRMTSKTFPPRSIIKPTIKVYKGTKKIKECFYICRTCLATNVKMYRFCELNTFAAYTQLTGVEDLGLYPYICYECAARFRKSEEFRSNCLKALETLSNKQLPEEIEADRELKGLKSPLQLQVQFEPFECRDTEISNQIDEVEIINDDYNDENCKKQEAIESHDHSYVIAEKEKRKVKTKKKEQNSDELIFPLKFYAKITTMTPEEAKREVEKRKQTINYKESPFKCNLCYQGFLMQNLYDDHMKKHTMASGIYECEFCFLRFPKIYIKKIHFAEFHKVKIFCKTCPFICFNPSLAKTHIMKTHISLKYKCDKCPRIFSDRSSLDSHKLLSQCDPNLRETNGVSSFCGDTFITDKELNYHISRTHKQQILEDIERDHDLKDSQSLMQVQVLDSEELEISKDSQSLIQVQVLDSEELEISNEVEIAADTIQELFEFDTHESDAVVEDFQLFNNNIIMEESYDRQDVIIENDKPEFDQTKRREQTLTLAEYLSSYKCFENDELNLSDIIDLKDHATIIKMTPEEAKSEVDKRKESKNYKESLYKCNLCYRGFSTKNAHANHMNRHSAINGKYQCKFCFLRFSKKNILGKHNDGFHKVKILCKKCPRVFTKPCKARHHMVCHEGVMYKCDECPKSFRVRSTLSTHKRVSHAKTFCAFCGDRFVNDHGLKLHIALAHKQEDEEELRLGHSCVECNVHFASETAYKRHLVLSENHLVSNGCRICGEEFAFKIDLKSHMLTHLDDTPTPLRPKRPQRIGKACPVCNKSYSSIKMYFKHMKSEHPDSEYTRQLKMKKYTFVCEFCGKSFSRQSSLEDHVNTHTKESSYKCNVCEKIFFSSAKYYVHQTKVHSSYIPFQCDLCGKVYKRKYSLEIHMKVRLYKC